MKKVIWIVLILVIAVGGWYAYNEYNRKNVDLSSEKPVASLKASELIAAFTTDTASANKQYIDKIFEVSGQVKTVAKEENPVVISLGDPGEMSSVQCSMDSAYVKEYASIKEGAVIRIKGMCTGAQIEEILGTDVKLNRCVISKN
jgi:RecJ-like exonuclease